MNERIRELAEEAGFIPGVMGLNRFTYFDTEKFAELIVRECASIAKHHVMNISTYADADFVDEQIREYFGIEE